jgi:Tol biopolymer transport system component
VRFIRLAFVIPLLPLFCSSEPTSTHASEKKPFDVRQLVELKRASEAALSPDGRTIVFVLRSTDMEANRGKTDLWVMGSTGNGLRRLTSHESNDWSPHWMGNKTVAFLSMRSGSPQVHVIEIDGGEAR